MLAIKINNLVKQYKNGVRALEGLSLEVNSGEIFSLLGPNGAGKSSLINILTTYFQPTSGSVVMLKKDLLKDSAWIRQQIACVAQRISIDTHLSLKENMVFQSRLYKVDPQVAKERIESLIDSFQLSDYLKYPVASYSGGVKRRLDIAMNLVSSPKILFLDEPTVGMDAISRRAMWKMLRKIRDEYKTTIFLTTHYLEEADQLSDTICIMKDGKEIVQGSPKSLRSYIRQNILRITFPSVEEAKKCKENFDNMELIKFTNLRYNTVFAGVEDKRRAFPVVNQRLLDHHIKFDAIEISNPNLEDVFLALMGLDEKDKEEESLC